MSNQDPFIVFNENIERSTKFVTLAELKELRVEFRIPIIERDSTLGHLLDEFRPIRRIRRIIKKWTSEIYDVGLPLVLVYSVSCLDACIKNHYFNLNGKKEYRERSFQRPDFVQGVFKKLGKDIFVTDEEIKLKKDWNDIINMRNNIIHEGKQYSLNAEIVKEHINIIKKAVQLVQQKTY